MCKEDITDNRRFTFLLWFCKLRRSPLLPCLVPVLSCWAKWDALGGMTTKWCVVCMCVRAWCVCGVCVCARARVCLCQIQGHQLCTVSE